MTRFLSVFFLTLSASAIAYAQSNAQLVLDRYEVIVRTSCGVLTETRSTIPPGKVTATRTCAASENPAITATTLAELTITVPASVSGTFVGVEGSPNGTFAPSAPVVSEASLKATMTVPTATGHAMGVGDGNSLCTNTTDERFSSAPFQGVRTLTLTHTCTRNVTNIPNSREVKVITYAQARPFGVGTNAMNAGNLNAPIVEFQVDAVYKLVELPSEDLIITHISVVQAVQTPYDEVSLIAGKKTAARVFIRSLGANAGPVGNVSARVLCNGVPANASTPSIVATRIPSPPGPGYIPDLYFDASVDVALPPSCIAPGTRNLEAEIVLPSEALDPNPSNNKLAKTLTFKPVPGPQPFRIAYVRMPYQPPGQDQPTLVDADLAAQADYQIREMFPIPEESLRYFPLTLDLPPYNKRIVNGADWGSFLDYFSATMLLTDPLPGEDFDQVVAFLPDLPDSGIAGSSTGLWSGGAGIATAVQESDLVYFANSFTHEIAHNLGLRHTNKSDPARNCNSFASDAESSWPWPNAAMHSHAYSQREMRPLGDLWDLMSYCAKPYRWVSSHSFESLFLNDLRPVEGLPRQIPLRSAAEQPEPLPTRSATPQELWLVSGTVRADGTTGTLNPFLRLTSSRAPQPNHPSGTHCIRFSLPGNATSSFCFSPRFIDQDGVPLESASFVYLIPVATGATRAALLVGAKELAALTAGGAVQVNITSPQAGEQWQGGGARTISWTSTGGAASYAVQYSSDGGASWWSLGTNLTTTSLTVNTSRLKGGTNLRFRVLAGAGLSTASGEAGPIQLIQNPKITVPAGTFNLHNAVAGQSTERKIPLASTGTGPLQISAIVPSSAQFKVISPAAPTTIMAGETVMLVIRFAPSAVGDVSGSVRIDSNDAAQPSVTIPLSGKGIAAITAEIGASPSTLPFGTVQQGKGATQTVKITNHGPAPLNLTAATVSGTGFALASASPAPLTLIVNETRDIAVRFVPTANGAANGTLTIASNDPVTPSLAIALTGTGSAPTSGITPPSIDANGVVNAASFAPGLTRGALGSVFGKNMSNGTQLVTAAIWPRLAQGAKILVAGIEAPLYYISPGLINFQIPYEVPLGPVQVVVIRDGYESAPQTVTISEFAIGVFGYPRTASDYDPILVHLDGSLVTPSNRGKAGEFLLIFVTGLGGLAEFPRSGVGAALEPLPAATAATTITIGGAPVQSLYTGLTPGFIGLGQMNIKLPDTLPPGAILPLRIQVGNSVITVNLHVQ